MSADTAEEGPTAKSVLATWREWYHLPGLALIALYMLWVRTLPYDNFVRDNDVTFSGNDPFYHFRATMYSVKNWPRGLGMDPWTQFPYGTTVGQFGTLFDIATATIALIIGLGDPSAKQVGTVAVLMPAVLGTLCVIPVYYTVHQLTGDRLSALFGSFVLAILPTSIWLSRSTAGTFDHHVAETLFMSLTVLATVIAVGVVQREKPVYEQVLDRDWAGLREPFKWSSLIGVAYAAYVWVWPPGVVIVGVLGTFFVIALSIETVRENSPEHLAFAGVVGMCVGAMLLLPLIQQFDPGATTITTLQIGLPLFIAAGCLFMAWLARQWNASDADPWGYPLTIGVLIVLGVVFLNLALPKIWALIWSNVQRTLLVDQADTVLTISEAQSMDLSNLGDQFYERYGCGFTFLTALLAALWLLVRTYVADRRWAQYLLLVVWTGFMTLMAMTQVRFHAYLVVPVAILNGWLFAMVVRVVDFPSFDRPKEAGTLLGIGLLVFLYPIADERHGLSSSIGDGLSGFLESAGLSSVAPFELWVIILALFLSAGAAVGTFFVTERGIVDPEEFSQLQTYHVLVILAVAMIIVVPIASPAAAYTAPGIAESSGPGAATIWEESNDWLAENTPRPGDYGGADDASRLPYYGTYDTTDDHAYPRGAYGVLSWWDYGHWITVQGERIPNANPFQQGTNIASEFMLADSEERADLLLEALPALDSGGRLDGASKEELEQIVANRTSREANEETRYIMIDSQMAGGKFGAITQWTETGKNTNYFSPQQTDIQNDTVAVRAPNDNYDDTMLSKLYFGDAAGLEHYRLVHENSRRSGTITVAQRRGGSWRTIYTNGEIGGLPRPVLAALRARNPNFAIVDQRPAAAVKTFERVEGATIEGEAEAGASVVTTLELQTNTDRSFRYTQRTSANDDGEFNLTVPYPTEDTLGPEDGYTNSAVRANGTYTVRAFSNGSVETGSVAVEDAAVANGGTVSMELRQPDDGGRTDGGNESDAGNETGGETQESIGRLVGQRLASTAASGVETDVSNGGPNEPDSTRDESWIQSLTPELGRQSRYELAG